MIWPSNLAVLYPYPELLVPWQVLGSVFLLIAITLAVFRMVKRFPYLATGWLWYIGTLVPVIGIVQLGTQAMADRYTYIPLIGIFIMVAWGIPDLLKKWKYRKEILLTSSAMIILCLSIITWTQVGYWRDSFTLLDHTLKVTDNNWHVYNGRGVAYGDLGNYRQAIDDFSRTIEIKPGFAEAYNNRGTAYSALGNYRQSIEDYGRAIEIKPGYAEAYNNRAFVYLKQGDNISGCRDALKACELGNCKLLEMAKGKGDCR
jgi:tetratricopeptide (TPR) repeat protein